MKFTFKSRNYIIETEVANFEELNQMIGYTQSVLELENQKEVQPKVETPVEEGMTAKKLNNQIMKAYYEKTPPTDKQIKLLQKNNLPIPETKSEAAELIREKIYHQPREY